MNKTGIVQDITVVINGEDRDAAEKYRSVLAKVRHVHLA